MIQRVMFVGMVAIFVILMLGCSAATPTAAPATIPQAAATIGPAPTRTIVALPPQPTSLPIATKAVAAFQSPTPAARVTQTGAVPGAVAPTNPPATVAAVAPTQAAPVSAGPIPTAVGVATGRRSEIKLAFLTPLKPAEEAEPAELVAIRTELKKVNGFMDISGDENLVTVGYDGGLVTAEQLIQKFAELKFPVKKS